MRNIYYNILYPWCACTMGVVNYCATFIIRQNPLIQIAAMMWLFFFTAYNPELRYLFDWSLPLHCPELARELTIPCYFAGDFLQRTPAGSLYQDSWPSLFLSPAGITSELHVDAFGSNFWMALFQGKKRFDSSSLFIHVLYSVPQIVLPGVLVWANSDIAIILSR